jgi:hypothetical protein
MTKRYPLLLMMAFLLILGCNEEITGIVVDAETGQPIEGAVVLVEWTKTSGLPGLRSTDSYKVFEALTDKEGKVRIDGIDDLFVNEPHVSVYRKGYVLWNNRYIFPGWKERTDFNWKNNYVFRLEKFQQDYSYSDHTYFIHVNTISHAGKKEEINNAYRWEEFEAAKERLRNKLKQ